MCQLKKCAGRPPVRAIFSHILLRIIPSLSALCWTWMCTSPCHVIPIPYHHTIPYQASPYHTMPYHTMSVQYILWAADPRCHPNPCHQTRASYRSLTLAPPAKFLYLVMQPLFSLTSQNRHFQISFRRADKISKTTTIRWTFGKKCKNDAKVVLGENRHHQSDVNRAMIINDNSHNNHNRHRQSDVNRTIRVRR